MFFILFYVVFIYLFIIILFLVRDFHCAEDGVRSHAESLVGKTTTAAKQVIKGAIIGKIIYKQNDNSK